MAGFTHLHCHSEYSLLDGLARVPDLVKTAKARGFDALALTDHGVMFGAVQFYQQAVKHGVKPILGCEVYVARRTRGERDAQLDRKSYHLTVLAENATGYRNLMALVSRAQLEGFYYRPRVDRELLAAHAEGLIVLSGCAGSEVATHIREGRMAAARDVVDWYRQAFPGRYYIELMIHDLDFIPELNRGLLALAREFDLPTVATNDVHYCRETDVTAHEVLLCVQTTTNMNDPKRMRIGDTFYLRTEAEMRALFRELPEAVDRTAEVVERATVSLDFDGYKLPRFEVPAGQTAASYLRALCEAGVIERYGEVTEIIRHRLDYELSVIGQMGFDDYFLIVWDLCRFAAAEGIWWNVRGSGAGSIVAYCLRVTNIDPLRHQLIFERFLNPSRISMPDIDLDFPDDQRDLLIRYTFQKYGHDKVAQIITFGTMGARAAIRDAGRALDMPLQDVDRVARLVPAVPGKACGIDDALRPPAKDEPNEFYTADLAALYAADDTARHLIDTARSLEGVARHASTHAAGVVISDRPLVDYVPLHRPTRGSGDADDPSQMLAVTQYNMKDIDSLGLLKVDFLGLSTLTVLRRAAEMVARYHDVHYTLDNIPLDDPDIYALLASGDVTGVFQVEGAGMRRMLRDMKPHRFEHVVAAIALYRPGPMEYIPTYIARLHGREPVRFRHPALEPILAETYGIIVYQEQIIQIARDLAGYDAGEADTIRKAVGKKIKEKLLEHRERFVAGAAGNGIPKSAAEGIFDDIETFARYGFNKAHAADYAVIVCQTAFLKAKYPVEYAAALLTVDRDNAEKIALVAADSLRQGIKLLAPSVNHSGLDFIVEPLDDAARTQKGITRRRGIRFGLAAIKNVGEGAAAALIAARDAGGPFATLDDLASRLDLRSVGKRAVESLIKAGALDAFGGRAALLAMVDRLVAASATQHQAADAGQMSLFGDAMPAAAAGIGPLPDVAGNLKEELLWEKELIGLYLSEHPLHRVTERLAATVTTMTGDIGPEMAGQPVTLAGLVTSVRVITTKKGDPMAFVRLEDLHGDVELTVFPRTFALTRDTWKVDAVVLVQGKVEARDERVQVLVDNAETYDIAPLPPSIPMAGEPAAEAVEPMASTIADALEPATPIEGQLASSSSAATSPSSTSSPSFTAAPPAARHAAPTIAAAHAPSPAQVAVLDDPPAWVLAPLADDDLVPADPDADPLTLAAATTPPPDAPFLTRGQQAERTPDVAPHWASGASEPDIDAPRTPRSVSVLAPTPPRLSLLATDAPTPSPSGQPAPVGASPTSIAAARAGEAAGGPRYRLEVTLPRSENQEHAISLMSQVVQLLNGYEGADRFTLFIPNGPELIALEFPNSTTRYCVDLLQRLKGVLGDGRIRVEATAGVG